MITSSFRMFKMVELLRLRAGLTARDAASLLDIHESDYSRLRAALCTGKGSMSEKYDSMVTYLILSLIDAFEHGYCPMDQTDKAPAIAFINARIKSHQLRSAKGTDYGITPADLNISVDTLLANARQLTTRLR